MQAGSFEFENDIYIVKERPNKDIPVFVVEKETGPKKRRTLHRNLLLPVNFLPLKPLPVPRIRKDVRRLEAPVLEPVETRVDLEEDSGSEEEDDRICIILNPEASVFKPVNCDVQEEPCADEFESEETREDALER